MKATAGIAALLLSLISTSASAWTESELFLSGLKQEYLPAELPASIEIPEAWRTAMLDIGASTMKNGKEHGLCMGLRAAANQNERIALMGEYAALRARKSEMDAQRYATEEQALRARIEGKGDTAAGTREWRAGAPQEGEQMQMKIEQNGVRCDGESLANAHTHPPGSFAIFSDSDFVAFLANENYRSAFVVYETDVCMALKSESATPDQAVGSPGVWQTYYAAAMIASLRKGEEPDWKSTSPSAGVAAALGLGLYCGSLKQARLMRAQAGPKPVQDPLFHLRAKGLALAIKLHTKDPADIPFAFTPEPDNELWFEYLDQVKWPGDGELGSLQFSRSAISRYSRLVNNGKFLADVGAGPDADHAPDFRSGKVKSLYRSACANSSKDPKKILCNVIEFDLSTSPWTALRHFASWESKDGTNYLVDRRKGKYVVQYRSPATGVSYDGECVFVKTDCSWQGKGRLASEGEFVYEGPFAKGKPHGQGVMTFLKEKETWKVQMTNGSYTKLAKVK